MCAQPMDSALQSQAAPSAGRASELGSVTDRLVMREHSKALQAKPLIQNSAGKTPSISPHNSRWHATI